MLDAATPNMSSPSKTMDVSWCTASVRSAPATHGSGRRGTKSFRGCTPQSAGTKSSAGISPDAAAARASNRCAPRRVTQ